MSQQPARFALFSEVFKALGHPKRLEIIHALREGERTATQLAEATGLSKTAVSQHLSVLKAQALVLCDKRGSFCYYRVASPAVFSVCEGVRQLVLEQVESFEAVRPFLATLDGSRTGEDGDG
ncbi:ArsR/SmtB family transcription factor [Thiohalorhabdus sp. Cl-TMA]|uniref:ArsR/SmtB family transcription factor n=1 Tax=Thiohalorhabdus methylotrophus TaxID=3242694 RepID=A0ABV4TSR1_9GAMM